MKKVLFITNIAAPYKVDFFNCLSTFVDLYVLFERRKNKIRQDSWLKMDNFKFNCKFLNHETMKCRFVKEIIKKNGFDFIVLNCYYTKFERKLISFFKRHKIRYVISSDGGYIKKDNFLKKGIKHFYLSNAEFYFSPSLETDKYLRHYAGECKIYRYPFTSVSNGDLMKNVITSEEMSDIKKDLGINEEKVVVGVGSFIHRKGWDMLLNAIDCDEIGYYIIGGKAPENYLDIVKTRNLTNVHFVEFLDKESVFKYYKAANAFVLPTREDIWGLVINEALACGLPIITTDMCLCGKALVIDDYNGFILKLSSKTFLMDLNTTIHKVIYNKNYLQLRANALITAKKFTIEEMAKCYGEVFTNEK